MPVKKKSYLEFYRDPRWQKKRLEVMERDGFKCRKCDSEDDFLNVHHCYYEDGKMPWEYKTSSLVTLCEECHSLEKESAKKAKSRMLRFMGEAGLMSDDYDTLACDIGYHLNACGQKNFLADLHVWLDEREKRLCRA